jgi:hypothetical protein
MLIVCATWPQESPFHSREISVSPSPGAPSEIGIPSGATVADYDVWPTGPDALILLHDSGGSHVAAWRAGDSKIVPLLDLPSGFNAASIATHPMEHRFFIAGKSGSQSQILAARRCGRNQQRHAVRSASRRFVPAFRSDDEEQANRRLPMEWIRIQRHSRAIGMHRDLSPGAGYARSRLSDLGLYPADSTIMQ